MGGIVEVHAVDGRRDAHERVRAAFEAHEAALSRFRPASELCALNASRGQPFAASPLLIGALAAALDWAVRTDGLFDPTIIDALEALGYDRTFDDLATTGGARRASFARPAGSWRDIALDAATRTVRMPPGVRVDLGGIGKGYTVDAAMRALGRDANALVNASGDLFAAGPGPEGDGWHVGVADPHAPGRDLAVVAVRGRGVATSAVTKRAWEREGRRVHHIVDPLTGDAAASDAIAVTVVAADATSADVLGTVVCIAGVAEGLRLVERFGAEALAVRRDGSTAATRGFERFVIA